MKILIPTFVMIFTVGAMVWLLASITKQEYATKSTAYQECKQKTNDIEWCVKLIKPNLE